MPAHPPARERPRRPLAAPLRQRINKLAHSHGLREESRQRAMLIAQLETARDAGATYEQLAAMLPDHAD